ncbi:hypothetical protein R1sor_025640 [Riccia sorocarpa]|uniref:F-box domain-containing protein n=1 Tax=Riccia sorocarpa TaxID=122646 RepID=A0ABD3G968_9MARC
MRFPLFISELPACMRPEHRLFPSYIRRQVTVPMDEEVWRNLPVPLIESLFNRLPLCERVPLRPVCRSWCRADGTDGKFGGDADLQALPVMVGDSSLSIYNVRRNVWKQKSMHDVYLHDVVSAFESSGGLIVAITMHSTNLLVVHNPISNKCRYILPPESFMVLVQPQTMSSLSIESPRGRYLHDMVLNYDGLTGLYRGVLGLICDEVQCKYNIILASTDSKSDRVTHVYDSVTGTWSEAGHVPTRVSFWYGGDNRIVCNGSLYCLAMGRFGQEGEGECILAKYVLSSGEWIFYPVPDVWDGVTYPFIVEHKKKVVFVTQSPGSETLHFYDLNEDESFSDHSWNLVAQMPKSLWSDFKAKADPTFTRCAGQKDLIYFTGRKRKGSGVVALVIDPIRGLFKWLPHLADDHLVFQLRVYKPSLMPV